MRITSQTFSTRKNHTNQISVLSLELQVQRHKKSFIKRFGKGTLYVNTRSQEHKYLKQETMKNVIKRRTLKSFISNQPTDQPSIEYENDIILLVLKTH